MKLILILPVVLMITNAAWADVTCKVTETLADTRQSTSYQISSKANAMVPDSFPLRLITARKLTLGKSPDANHYFVTIEPNRAIGETAVNMVSGPYSADWYGLAGVGDLSLNCSQN